MREGLMQFLFFFPQSEVETRIEQIRVLREKMKSVTEDTRDKEEMLKQLVIKRNFV